MSSKSLLNFVLPNRSTQEIEQMIQWNVDSNWQKFISGPECWVLQTYLLASQKMSNLMISNKTAMNCLNLIHGGEIKSRNVNRLHPLINLRADYPKFRHAAYEIVQNKLLAGPRSFWIPHWPQPGLIPRNNSRIGCSRVGYFGRRVNHYSRWIRYSSGFFRVEELVGQICSELGLDFVCKGPDCWNDYSDVDVVIGHRSFSSNQFRSKPATKLTNSWLADVVFVGGSDSAYSQVGSPGIDYCEAKCSRKLRTELNRLKVDVNHFNHIRKAGRDRVFEYCRSGVLSRWVNVLERLKINF